LPKIGITLGDPGGIGPEIILKAFSSEFSLPQAHYILFGSSRIIEEEKRSLALELDIPSLHKEQPEFPSISLKEIENPLKNIKKGAPYKEAGQASFLFFKEAIEEAKKGKIHALVTAPIAKRSWNLAGLEWAGHTDFLNQSFPRAIMVFWSEKIKVALFTHHIPLKTAIEKIKKEALLDFFLLLHQRIKKIHPEKYHFLVAGLNPHAGEDNLMGSEEEDEIAPAIEQAQRNGMRISGPFPPDTIFRYCLNQPENIAIALYHDQGLIPFKLEAFDSGVNVTLGLPFVRTSPDHGTAFDIAGKGIANPQSMVEAIKLAFELTQSPF
ncbi:MAG: 4-hydroxythreonine-4-phosphate dehydrogenase PdxA, partial [Candidatus Aminicenantes bacterium]